MRAMWLVVGVVVAAGVSGCGDDGGQRAVTQSGWASAAVTRGELVTTLALTAGPGGAVVTAVEVQASSDWALSPDPSELVGAEVEAGQTLSISAAAPLVASPACVEVSAPGCAQVSAGGEACGAVVVTTASGCVALVLPKL